MLSILLTDYIAYLSHIHRSNNKLVSPASVESLVSSPSRTEFYSLGLAIVSDQLNKDGGIGTCTRDVTGTNCQMVVYI